MSTLDANCIGKKQNLTVYWIYTIIIWRGWQATLCFSWFAPSCFEIWSWSIAIKLRWTIADKIDSGPIGRSWGASQGGLCSSGRFSCPLSWYMTLISESFLPRTRKTLKRHSAIQTFGKETQRNSSSLAGQKGDGWRLSRYLTWYFCLCSEFDNQRAHQ